MKRPLAIFLIWLFHISATIGITIGHKDWFLSKTPMNLSLSLFLFFWVFSMDSVKKGVLFALFFAMGMFAEWLGVNYQLLFGTYAYGANFGPQLDGVPWLIGCFWALLAFVSFAIAQKLPFHKYIKLVIGAVLMVLLDYLMELNAPNFAFWEFEGTVPLKNYVTWFVLGLIMQVLLWVNKIDGDKIFSVNLYLAQFIFFLYFAFVRV
ncbi:MAG: carotenoid biosynthesis protein [Bacteroidota bacterium]